MGTQELHRVFRTALVIALLFISVVEQTDGQLNANDYMAIVRSVCPNNVFCEYHERTTHTTQGSLCCAECSCDSTCHVIGNCCPDAAPLPFSDKEGRCTTIARHLNEGRNVSVPRLKTKHIRVITECPDDSRSQNDVTRCQAPTCLEDYQLVSNPVTRRIYANIHCATCHDDTSVIPWTLSVYNCSELLQNKHTFKSYAERDNFVLKHCPILAFPVDSYDDKNNACFNDDVYGADDIRDCKSSTNMTSLDDDIRAACLYSSDQGKGLPVYTNDVTYANPFCFLCNVGYMPSPVTCKQNDLLHPVSLIPLDVGSIRLGGSKCEREQVFDSRTSRCMELYCPPGTVPNYGDCVYPLHGGDYLSLEVYFAVQFDVDVQPERFVLHASVLHRIETKVHQFLEGHCATCDTHMYRSGSQRRYYLKIVFQTQETCEDFKVIATLHDLFDNGFNSRLVISGQELVVNIQPVDLIMRNVTDMRVVSMEMSTVTCSAPEKYHRDLPSICPFVRVSWDELRHTGITEHTASAIVNMTSAQIQHSDMTQQSENNAVNICLKDFFALKVSTARARKLNEDVFNRGWSNCLYSISTSVVFKSLVILHIFRCS